MNKILGFILVLLMIIPIVGNAQGNLSKGLVTRYLFNGDAKDASSNGNDGTRMGGVIDIKDRFGNDCAAFDFNGIDGYVEVPHSRSLSSPQSEITISAWLKLKQGTPFSDLQWMTIVCKSDNPLETGNSPQYRLQSTKVTVSVNTDFTEQFNHMLDFEEWFYYSMTYNGQEVTVYVDGKVLTTFSYFTEFQPNNLPLNIGRDVPGVLEFYGGAMDDLRIYNRALSSNEIQELYQDDSEKNSPKPCSSSACEITNIVANPLDCYNDSEKSLFDVELSVSYDNPPKSGSLIIESGGIKGTLKTNFSGKSNIILEGLTADGNDAYVKSYFTKDSQCSFMIPDLYVSPKPCEKIIPMTCKIIDIEAKEGPCYFKDGFSLFDVSLKIKHENVQKGDELAIKIGRNKKTITITNDKISKVVIKELPVKGNKLSTICYLVSDSSCKLVKSKNVLPPDPDSCNGISEEDNHPKVCEINSVEITNIGECYPNAGKSYYNLKLLVDYVNAPSNCELLVYIGDEKRKLNCSNDEGGEIFTIKKLLADGESKDIIVNFIDESSCAFILDNALTSPSSCTLPPPVKNCSITKVTADATDCKVVAGKAVYDVELNIEFANPPSSGTLIAKIDKEVKKVTFSDRTNNETVSFIGLEANGESPRVTVYFEANNKCVKVLPNLYTAPQDCNVNEDENPGVIDYQEEIVVKNPNIRLFFYDRLQQDGDVVSVRWDGKWIVNKLELKRKNNEDSIDARLQEGVVYELVSKAWNLGTKPPNTLTVEIYDVKTKESQLIKLDSRIGTSGAMKITYEP